MPIGWRTSGRTSSPCGPHDCCPDAHTGEAGSVGEATGVRRRQPTAGPAFSPESVLAESRSHTRRGPESDSGTSRIPSRDHLDNCPRGGRLRRLPRVTHSALTHALPLAHLAPPKPCLCFTESAGFLLQRRQGSGPCFQPPHRWNRTPGSSPGTQGSCRRRDHCPLPSQASPLTRGCVLGTSAESSSFSLSCLCDGRLTKQFSPRCLVHAGCSANAE